MTAKEAIMERLDEMFPDRNLLAAKDLVRYTGLSMNTTLKMFGLKRGAWIDKNVVADRLTSVISTKDVEETA